MKTSHYTTAILMIALFVASLGLNLDKPLRARPLPGEPATFEVEDGPALLESAEHQFGAGNYMAAMATLRSIIAQNPLSAEAFYWLARCYFEVRDFDNAVMHAEKAVALQPLNSVYQDLLGRAYGEKADHDKSFFVARKVKKQFQQAVVLDPTNIAARRDLEEFCMQAPWIVGGNGEEARAQADAIAKLDPVEGHLAHASYDLQVLKKPDLADAEFKEVLDAKAAKPDAYFEAANFFEQQNRPTDVNAAIEASAHIDPNDARLPFYRAVWLVLTDSDHPRAEEYLKSYLASTPERSEWPSHARAREWLGRLYEEEGKRAEAAEQYRASLQLQPGRKSAQERLAKLGQRSK